jgi:N-acetyl-1-D-myo-inositol-2-amino-2-deoxy-alpha-D-glucopyranoside deacetylase
MVSDDAEIAVEIRGEEHVDAKLKALRAHATQITEDGPFFAGADVVGPRLWAREYYRFAAGTPFAETGTWADDLFAGLA